MRRFVKLAIAFRRAHPSLARSRFWREDVQWYDMGPRCEHSPEASRLAFCLHGSSENDADLYAMINASQEAVTLRIQEGAATEWRRAIDTSRPSPDDFRVPGEEARLESHEYRVNARSVVVFLRCATL